MSELLSEFLAAGLIDKVDGDDERFAKMERASAALAAEFRDHPSMLIRAILAALDPDIPATDPAVCGAEKALVAQWKSMASVYPDPPVGLYRAVLLDACVRASEGNNATILWMTMADTLPFARLGTEGHVVWRTAADFARQSERLVMAVDGGQAAKRPAAPKLPAPEAPSAHTIRRVDRTALMKRIAASVGPQSRNNKYPLEQPNPHWSNSGGNWSWEYTDRMRDLLADELDRVADSAAEDRATVRRHFHATQGKLAGTLQNALTNQRRWVKNVVTAAATRSKTERQRLDALWWAEALYSTSLRRSYRELPPSLAAVVMAVDLLDTVTVPTPASVGYLLAETVNRLAGVSFDDAPRLSEVLTALRGKGTQLPSDWHEGFCPPPVAGRLSIRDLIVLAINGGDWPTEVPLERAGLDTDAALSLPALAHALFRQEQAVRLAEEAK